MFRFCVFAVMLLLATVFINACGSQESLRNCSGGYTDAYQKVFNYIFVYSRVANDNQDFESTRRETASACQELQTNYGDVQCMALKQGLSRKISYDDFRADCNAVHQGQRIPKKY